MQLQFDNRFRRELPGEDKEDLRPRQVFGACWSPVTPTPVSAPRLLAYSDEMAQALGLSQQEVESEEFAQVFAGNRLLQGMESYSACYGGHQFGHWAGQLGDGRAISLGEVINEEGQRWVLQLKGAGPTPYSRRADGRAVLRSSLREFLCSEAMHHLGVPTTRALSLVTTGDEVIRDMMYSGNPRPEPGAIVCRVSPSFVRFGNFEIFAFRGEHEVLEQLVNFTIARDFSHLQGEGPELWASWFQEVCESTARLMVEWMRVGFVHGVMNTDNMSILGLTIDYGPYGWIDNFDPNWTPNTTDLPGRRYRFAHQPRVAQWNLLRLANALAVLFETTELLEQGLEAFAKVYARESLLMDRRKFGLREDGMEDEELITRGYTLMARGELDMTLFFRRLAEFEGEASLFDECFYDSQAKVGVEEEFGTWLQDYQAILASQGQEVQTRKDSMNRTNPLYVPRNYLAQEAINQAEESGDATLLMELLDTLRRPYEEQAGAERFARKRPEWARNKPGCSMLSCSS